MLFSSTQVLRRNGFRVRSGGIMKAGKTKRSENFPVASLEVQWLRICLPTQETWVQSLIWEDPTCPRTPKPMRHNY